MSIKLKKKKIEHFAFPSTESYFKTTDEYLNVGSVYECKLCGTELYGQLSKAEFEVHIQRHYLEKQYGRIPI
jgi:hypothetical protein